MILKIKGISILINKKMLWIMKNYKTKVYKNKIKLKIIMMKN